MTFDVSQLPQAERGVWHKVIGDLTRAQVMGEMMPTMCGCKVSPELVPEVGRGARTPMPMCPRCQGIIEALKAEQARRGLDLSEARLVELNGRIR